MKWLGKHASEGTWITEEELKRVDPKRYAEVFEVFSSGSSSSQPSGVDAEAYKRLPNS